MFEVTHDDVLRAIDEARESGRLHEGAGLASSLAIAQAIANGLFAKRDICRCPQNPLPRAVFFLSSPLREEAGHLCTECRGIVIH